MPEVNVRHADAAPLSGVVMAGGFSSRFGSDKAAIEVSGQSLLDKTVALLAKFVDEVFVSVRSAQTSDNLRSKYTLLIDNQDDNGPMAGLLAAHRREPQHAWLALACDMPLMDESTLSELIDQRDARRAATACRSPVDGMPEPLCAIYEPDTLARFSREARAGRRQAPREQLMKADICLIAPSNPAALRNVNRPEDLAELERVPTIKR